MYKSDIFRRIIETVAKETEIPTEKIMGGGKSREEVDARHLTVYFLKETGFYDREIARSMNISIRWVQEALRMFDTRKKQNGKLFGITFEQIKKSIGSD